MLGIAPGARLGVNKNLGRDLDQLKALGCPAIRWTLPWLDTERVMGSGDFDWTHGDAMLAALAEREMEWCLTIGTRADGNLFAPDHVAAIGPFAAATAARYFPSGTVIGFEGPNESNLEKASKNQTPAEYVACQRAIFEGIRNAVGPAALVGNGGIIGSSKELVALYAAGLKTVVDMVIWHPYTHPLSPTQSMQQQTRGWWAMHEARQVMVANGDAHKQIWITEYGTNTDGREPSPEAVQASDLTDAVTRFRRHTWTGPMFVFCGVDNSPMTTDPGDSMGLLRADGTEKPAAAVYRELVTAA